MIPDTTTTLINFRAPVHLKTELDLVCRYNHQSKTSVLLMLIREFVKQQSTEIEQEMEAQRRLHKQLGSLTQKFTSELTPETWNGYVKDPKTGTWFRSEE